MAYTTFVLPFRPVFDSNGLPVPGAGLNFYLTGTVIRTPVYADSALTTELPNPVVANSAGRFVDIYMDAAVIYRVTVTDDSGVVLDDADPYSFGNAGVGVDLISTQTISGAKTFSSNITIPDEVYGVGWDADMGAPTKNAVYDKLQTLGTVSTVSVTTAAGVSGTVATATTTPAITITLGAITPTSVTTATLGHATGVNLQIGGVTKAALTTTGLAVTGIVTVTDAVYGAGWNGSLEVPTKNAVYDKVETLMGEWTLLSTTTIAGATANVTQTGLSTYQDILIAMDDVSHNDAGNQQIYIHYSTDGTTFPVSALLTIAFSAATLVDAVAFVTTMSGHLLCIGNYQTTSTPVGNQQHLGAALSAIKLQWAAGSFDAGTIKIYAR